MAAMGGSDKISFTQRCTNTRGDAFLAEMKGQNVKVPGIGETVMA